MKKNKIVLQNQMKDFQIGDTVQYVGRKTDVLNYGMIGTVISFYDENKFIGIAFNEFCNGHDLNGFCKDGHGWWFGAGFHCSISNINDLQIIK